MHYSIFIPCACGADPKQLVGVGLGDLLRPGDPGPQMQELPDAGPSGGPGLLFVWQGSLPVYRPGELTWYPAKEDKSRGLAKGRFWWGIDPANPPTPAELLRGETLRFNYVECGDTTWRIPNIMLLPHNFILDDNGDEAREVSDQWRAIYDRGLWAYEQLKAQVEQSALAPATEMRAYVIDMLALNYRIFRDLAYHLRLMSDANWFSLACATVDLDSLMAIEQDVAKKKRAALEALIAMNTSPPGDGPKA